jgi:methyl-accepting chemotaxis protein
MEMRYRRQKLNLSVNRQFQMWLLVRILGVVLLSSLVAALVLYLYSRQEISSSLYTAHIQLRRVSDLLLPVMGAGAFVSLVSGMALALFLPQKIAGPVYRIDKSLCAIREGDLTEVVRLRQNDTLADLAASVNETTAALRSKIQAVKELQRELDQVVTTLGHRQAAEISARQNTALQGLRT